MAKYDEKLKKAVVQEYLSGRVGYKSLAAKYGLAHSVVQQWVGHYQQHGDAGLRRKRNHHSAEFKLSVLNWMWQQERSCTQAAVFFDVRGGAGLVSIWERRYHEGGLDALKPKPRGRPKKMKTPEIPGTVAAPSQEARTWDELRKENERLRAEVAYLKKLDALARTKKQAAPTKRKP